MSNVKYCHRGKNLLLNFNSKSFVSLRGSDNSCCLYTSSITDTGLSSASAASWLFIYKTLAASSLIVFISITKLEYIIMRLWQAANF